MYDLSIIIPNFNSGPLLEESLKYIFNESVSISFEVLILDNCSLDNPEECIKKFPSDNLFFISEPDSGIYDAMNKGIRKARGGWFYFLGAGDLVEIQNLAKVISQSKSGLGIIYGDVFHLKSNLLIGGEFDLFRMLRINLCHQAILYSSSIFRNGSCFSLNYKILSDYHFNLRLFFDFQAAKVYMNEIFCLYRGGGISELERDYEFNGDKNKIILELLVRNFALKSLNPVFKYYKAYFFNKLKITINDVLS